LLGLFGWLAAAEVVPPQAVVPAPLSAEQKARAAEAMAAMSAEDALADEITPPQADDGLSKDDRLLLQGLEFDLLEAERWIKRGDAAFAGEAFLRYQKQRQAIDDEGLSRLAQRLKGMDKRQLALARALLNDLPVGEELGQDDEAVAVPVPSSPKAPIEPKPKAEADSTLQGE